MQRTYGVALIGLGIMGLRMVERLNAHPGFFIAALHDPSPEAIAKAKAAAPASAVCTSAVAAIDRPDVQVVYVATPPTSHPDHVHTAFDHDKAVFCEKPLTADLDAGRRLVARVAAEGRPASVNFSLAASPVFRAVEDELRQGIIGARQRIDIRCGFRIWPRPWQTGAAAWLDKRADGGFVREVVSHFLFAALRVGGALAVRDSTVAWPSDGETSERAISATLTAGAMPMSLEGRIGATDADDTNTFEVTGDKGSVRIRDWAQADRRAAGSDDWETLALGTVEEVRWRGAQGQLDELHAMLDGSPHRLASFAEAFAVQQAVEALLAGR